MTRVRRSGPGIAAKWNARYAAGADQVPGPAAVLLRAERWLPPGAGGDDRRTALDLACGRAGNGEWLGARGFEAHAVDVSTVVVDALRARTGSTLARALAVDVMAEPPRPASFDVIVVSRFLERDLCPAIAAALRPGGLLCYQTFTGGLSDRRWLLGPNELLALFPTLEVLEYAEPAAAPGARAEAMLVGRAPRPAVADR